MDTLHLAAYLLLMEFHDTTEAAESAAHDLHSKKPEHRKFRDDPTFKASIHECEYTSLMVGAGENFLGPFVVFLKATNLQLGLLSSLPLFLGSVSQLVGVWLSERSPSRLRIIVTGALLQALVWIPMALLYFLFGASETTVWLVIALYAAYQITGNLLTPAWSSLIGDIVPSDVRGRYFGLRNERGAIVMLLTLLGAGGLMQVLTSVGLQVAGFALLFLSAFGARMVARRYLTLHRDPPYQVDLTSRFSYLDFLKRSPKSNFARFVFFMSCMSFSVMLSGPFFAVYMLDVLHFSYFTFTVMTAMVLSTMFLTMRYWGRLADRYGNKSILRLCAMGVVINPILWLIWSSVPGVMLIQAFGGVAWAGYNLAMGNFLFDAVTPPKRARCVAYQSITNCLFIFFGSIFGAWLVNHLPGWLPFDQGIWTPQSPYLRIFLLSGILRGLVCYFLLPTFKEVREVSRIGQTELFMQFLDVLPYIGTTVDFFTRRRSRPGGSRIRKES